MHRLFRDYFWKDGIPRGKSPLQSNEEPFSEAYKIVEDPYRKRISIEKYSAGNFSQIIYDSALLDFRHLKAPEQTAWQRMPLKTHSDEDRFLIRNQDDRALFTETYFFENGLCRACHVHSIHGIPLSIHKMFYKALQDSFNGVVLYDLNDHPVMFKHYEWDAETGEFTNLIKEEWNQECPK